MANELSLVISNPNEGEFLKKIIWNKEEFMELVASITEQYKGVSYTEEQMKSAKDDRATLNKMKKAISDRRIEIKNMIMSPYTQFENEVKEVVALIEEPMQMIDGQIKEYEERVKKEKKEELESYFNTEATELGGIVGFERIFDLRWLNSSVSIKKAKEEIDQKINSIKIDLRSIETLCEEKYQTVLKDFYIKGFSISKTLEECSRLKELDRKIEEEKARKEEEERLKAEQEAKRLAEQEAAIEATKVTRNVIEESQVVTEITPKEEEKVVAPPVSSDVVDPFASEKEVKNCKASFTVYGTKEQIMKLKQYMIDNNIKFGKVE